jgi:hypothetical protein
MEKAALYGLARSEGLKRYCWSTGCGGVQLGLNPAFVLMQEERGSQQLKANPSLEEPAFWNQFCFLYPILNSSIVSLLSMYKFPNYASPRVINFSKG